MNAADSKALAAAVRRQRDPLFPRHGHVRPRPDGTKARCLGEPMCPVCQEERRALDRANRSMGGS